MSESFATAEELGKLLTASTSQPPAVNTSANSATAGELVKL
jgi:hypothetical protein